MTKPIIRIHDIATNEIVDREMTVAEFKQYEANLKIDNEIKAKAEAKAVAKSALLEKLGITADEAKLLLG
jgi:hypothetical protein